MGRLIRISRPVAWRHKSGWLEVCARDQEGGKWRSIFLDPARVSKVYVLEVSGKPIPRRQYFIEYESDNEFYERFWVNEDVARMDVAKLEINPWWLRLVTERPSRYIVYLRELEEWDKYSFSLCTALEIYYTNIHPYYGVMD